MYLIEYGKGHFINANSINSVHVNAKSVKFYAANDGENEFCVEESYTHTFLNHLQALNANISDITSRHYELRGLSNDD